MAKIVGCRCSAVHKSMFWSRFQRLL